MALLFQGFEGFKAVVDFLTERRAVGRAYVSCLYGSLNAGVVNFPPVVSSMFLGPTGHMGTIYPEYTAIRALANSQYAFAGKSIVEETFY
jgi:hypothetical protein